MQKAVRIKVLKTSIAGWFICAAIVIAPMPVLAQQDSWQTEFKRALELYRAGKYTDALPHAERAAERAKAKHGLGHADYATILNLMGIIYSAQGRYADAEPPFKRSLAIREKALGSAHVDVGHSLNNLAELYRVQGRYAEAEPLYKRSLAIREKALGSNHHEVGAASTT